MPGPGPRSRSDEAALRPARTRMRPPFGLWRTALRSGCRTRGRFAPDRPGRAGPARPALPRPSDRRPAALALPSSAASTMDFAGSAVSETSPCGSMRERSSRSSTMPCRRSLSSRAASPDQLLLVQRTTVPSSRMCTAMRMEVSGVRTRGDGRHQIVLQLVEPQQAGDVLQDDGGARHVALFGIERRRPREQRAPSSVSLHPDGFLQPPRRVGALPSEDVRPDLVHRIAEAGGSQRADPARPPPGGGSPPPG